MELKRLASDFKEYRELQKETTEYLHGFKPLHACSPKVQLAIEEIEKEKRMIAQLAQEGIEEKVKEV